MDVDSSVFASVIIPTYNSSSIIRDCITSLLSNKCDFPFEIIVVDGGSKDDTKIILQSMAMFDNRIRVLDNPNETVPWAINIGVTQSCGNYIFLASAHSRFPPDYLATLVNLASTS